MTTHQVDPSGCPFCAIVKRQAPAREVLRTDHVLAFLPEIPAVLGHTLVIPKEHIRDIWGVDRLTGHALADVIRRVATAVSNATGAEGMNIIQSNGAVAGQSVFHLHIHVVPRHPGDRMPYLWPIDADWSGRELDSVAHALRVAAERDTFDQS